jgi:HSP20 family protein
MLQNSFLNAFSSAFPSGYSVWEKDGEYTMAMEAPGIQKEDIRIDVTDRVLTIKGSRKDPRPKDAELIRDGLDFSDLEKTFTLGDGIDRDSIEAKLVDGVLFLSMRMRKGSGPRKIKVS